MALLLMIFLLSVTRTLVFSTLYNKTDCNFISPADHCKQFGCHFEPCTLLCNVTKQYDACSQICHESRCDSLSCRASRECRQMCPSPSICRSMTCDAKECDQFCGRLGNCNNMKCSETVNNCTQIQAREMTCEADACDQTCSWRHCQMTCPIGGNNCKQVSTIGAASASIDCDRAVCDQGCYMGRCNMTCQSSGVTTGSCKQFCSASTCESMVCNATNCSQVCFVGDCNMTCPFGVKSCTQEAHDKNVSMLCDGEVCKQVCSTGSCNMTCSANVKECHQICSSEKCVYKCDADKCKVEGCFDGSPCTTVKPTSSVGTNISPTTNVTITTITIKGSATAPLRMGSLIFGTLILAYYCLHVKS